MTILKNNFSKFLIILLIGASIFSCKDDESSPAPAYTGIEKGSIQAVINGNDFMTADVKASKSGGVITINISAVTKGMNIFLTDTEQGNYTLGGDKTNAVEYLELTSAGIDIDTYTTSMQESASGTINIQEVDEENKTISGSIDAILISDTDPDVSIIIENGLFNEIPY